MSGNLLNNDNKTNYLFKKENFKAQTRLEEQSTVRGPKTIQQEGYPGKVIVLQESIFGVDISKNIPSTVYVSTLYGDTNINDSLWNNTTTDQTITPFNLSTTEPSLTYYKFYKRVYLEPVEPGNPCFWWLREDTSKAASSDNNLLSKMVPGGLSSVNNMFNPIVEFYDDTLNSGAGGWVNNEKATTFELPTVKSTANWTIDYASGILTLNVDEQHIVDTDYTLDASSIDETERPRISFIRYEGTLGGGTGGGGGSGGGITDASYNELKDDIDLVNEKIDNYLFDVPEKVIGISHEEIITSTGSAIEITWTNPEQKCAAFDFFQIHNDGPSSSNWAKDLDQTYYVENDGLQASNISIWQVIKRSMNKLPFHDRLRVQFKEFDPNNSFQSGNWTDFREAQIKGTTGTSTATSDNNRELYPIFKDITKIIISSTYSAGSGGSVTSSLTDSLTKQDIASITSSAPLCYESENFLDNTKVYHFRVALDNRSCIEGKEYWESNRDISNNLNWAYVPADLSTYIELGSYGPAPAPSNIQFVSGENAFDNSGNAPFVGTITGSAGNGTGTSSSIQVMDLSFNTAFPGPVNLTVQYGFALSGDIKSNSKQLGSRNTNNGSLQYANENSFTFDDLSFNTVPIIQTNGSGGISQALFSTDLNMSANGWNYPLAGRIASDFGNGIALPEHTYDISNAYMANNKFEKNGVFPFKAFALKSSYNSILPDESIFASPRQTSNAIFSNNTYMDAFINDTIDPTSTTPNYVINLSDPPSNYYGSTNELKEVRDENLNTKYVIFLKNTSSLDISFNSGGFSPAFTGSNNINFITCPQLSTTDVGIDISGNQIAEYDISFNYYKGSKQSDNVSVIINGYDKNLPFPSQISNSNTVNSMITSISVENADPTGLVSSRTTLQEQFGGYYNIQKIMKATGISNITLASVDDVALQTSKYDPYSIILRQTLSLQSNIEGTKRINLLIGEAPINDITVSPSLVDLGNNSGTINLTTNCKLFGARMPDSNILFHISTFNVTDINNNWVWPGSNTTFMDLSFNYFYNNSGSKIELDQESQNYSNPVGTSVTKDWDIIEALNSSPLVNNNLYKYSRSGKENDNNTTSEAQFSVTVNVKNNIYSTQSPNDKSKTENYYSNSPVTTWDWSSGNGNRTLWWDYTYSGTSTTNGLLPLGFVTISNQRAGSVTLPPANALNSKLQLQKKTVNLFQQTTPTQSGGYHVLGGASTASGGDQSWYDTDYDHSNTDISDNQLLWSDGSFKCGGPSSSANPSKNDNILNPYIDYNSYYYSYGSALLPSYDLKFDKGENWTSYTVASGEGFTSGVNSVAEVYNGKYKWLLVRLSWNPPATYNVNSNPWSDKSQIEVYVSESGAASKTNRLTLGTDYVMWICAVGNGLSGQNVKTFTDSSGTNRKRCGWLDCQRKKPTTSNFGDGEGCMDKDKFTTSNEYKFTIPTITNNQNSSTNVFNGVTDIFLRIGIPNSGSNLTSGDSYYNNKKIANISVKLNA